MRIFFLLFSITLLYFGCASDSAKKDPFSDCSFGRPEPIFSDTIAGIKEHEFAIRGKVGIEELVLPEGINLTINQTGCEEIHQEFRFVIPGDYSQEEDIFWLQQAIIQLSKLSQLGPSYFTFNLWAEEIYTRAESFTLGEAVELQPGFSVKIDKIVASDHAILLLTLSGSK